MAASMTRTVAPVGSAGRAFAWLGAGLFVVSLAYFLYSYAVTFGRVAASAGSGAIAPVTVNLALFTVFAVHHSVMARTAAKQWLAAHVPPALERSLYVWVGSLLFLWTCAAWQPVPGVLWDAPAALRLPLHGLQLVGVWLTLRSAAVIDVWDLAGIRQAEGRGRLPAFKVVGPYHVVRHPIYLGWALITFAAPLMTGTRLAFAVISTLYLVVAIPFEERSLVETFGEEYRAYQRRVRWRIVPGIY